MYTIDSHDRVIELDNVPKSTTGVPRPIVLAGEFNVLLSFYLQENQEEWPETFMETDTAKSEDDPVAIVNFDPCFVHMFGPPNDEALEGHPLFERGLSFYGAYEVANSSWLRILEKMNSVHRRHNKERFMAGERHFIFTFHDSTFECIAKGFSVELAHGLVWDMIPRMKKLIR